MTDPATDPSEMYRVHHTSARNTSVAIAVACGARIENTPHVVATPFAAAEPEPDRIDVPEHRGNARNGGPGRARIDLPRHQHARDALADVERHGADADFLGGRAQQIGRAHVAAAGLAQIDPAMAAGQEVRERDRSEQIPDDQSDESAGSHVRRSASASGIYVGPGRREAAFVQGNTIDPHGPAAAGISCDFG